MDSRGQFSFANLFNLESLVNFKLPRHDEELDDYGNSSQDETRGGRGGAMAYHSNGTMSHTDLSVGKRKKRDHLDPDSGFSSTVKRNRIGEHEVDNGHHHTHITEERYRSMLGDHLQKYKNRLKDTASTNPTSARTIVVAPKSNIGPGSKARKLGNDHKGLHEIEKTPELQSRRSPLNFANSLDGDHSLKQRSDRALQEPVYLEIGEGIAYEIPPTYDMLTSSLNLPSFSDIRIEELYLKGTLDLGSLSAMMASDRRLLPSSRAGMGEVQPQYESLQAKLKSMSSDDQVQNFSLRVTQAGLNIIPEGAAGRFRRSILTEAGQLQVFFVRVLEKGDTYEIIERSLPKKPKFKKDPSVIEREETEKIGRVWISIARKDIPKHHRVFINNHRRQVLDAKRVAELCQKEVKLKVSRSLKVMRQAPVRTRRLARDMLVYWKRAEKEMAEARKRKEKEDAEARKRKQELDEAKRQQKRLDFLLSQTELFSHFMQNKATAQPTETLPSADDETSEKPFVDEKAGEEEDPEDAKLKEEALRAAQDAVSKQKKLTSAFDNECSKLRGTEDSEDYQDSSVTGSSNIDLVHPSTMPVTSTVKTPQLFKGSLKEYQLKGLQWLVNCYEQGLNGILADEMGLGKTIQAMSFLAHLAEDKNIWGPFLVVAPASVLNNWADEVGRFCPDLKTLPYWGGLNERQILRKNINPKRLYRRDAGFHILITSYQLLVADEKYLKRVKWQYMVLDEAQAIKSSNSIRWKTLLSFNCRNRLLLTGTPVQNNMAELWALLHFIMPTLFDSHDQFNEWFSKGIESHAEHGGTLNEHQLNRLHAVLKPFMLRRVKKDVVSELTGKTEITVHCKLSSRQQAFYQAIKNKISLAELFDNSRGHLNEKKILNLMNIVIQLRKVCNHPELFERNEGTTYLYFGDIPNSLLPPAFGELEDVAYSGGHNPVSYKIPKLVYLDVARCGGMLHSGFGRGISRECFEKRFNIFSPDAVHLSSIHQENDKFGSLSKSGTFGFARLMNLSPSEFTFVANGSTMERLMFSIIKSDTDYLDSIVDMLMDIEDGDQQMERCKVRAVTKMLLLPSKTKSSLLSRKFCTGPGDSPYEALVVSHVDRLLSNISLLHSTYTSIPRSRAPPIEALCSDRNFSYRMLDELHNPWLKRLFVGFARTSDYNGPKKPCGPHHLIEEIDADLPVSNPALRLTYDIFGSSPPMQSFDPARLLSDSGKLQTLDILLKRLRAGNHRVLLFAQMTKMLNILEDYMNYRKYRYLRLDGSSTIMDRRDMVKDFQLRSDIFVFLLSTRAGGLGINLTAADTVIFYESDWNPTLDLQAMDRAHRLGQTKDVTVYRLICKETVEEKILQRASQKNTVQQLVMTGGHVQGDLLAPEDVVSLLIDDAQLEQKLREVPQVKDKQKKKHGSKGIRIDAEGDASLEDLDSAKIGAVETPSNPDHGKSSSKTSSNLDNGKSSSKKRKASNDKQSKVNIAQTTLKGSDPYPSSVPDDEFNDPSGIPEQPQQKSKRLKRQTKSVNENIEPAIISTTTVMPPPQQELLHFQSPSPYNANSMTLPGGNFS